MRRAIFALAFALVGCSQSVEVPFRLDEARRGRVHQELTRALDPLVWSRGERAPFLALQQLPPEPLLPGPASGFTPPARFARRADGAWASAPICTQRCGGTRPAGEPALDAFWPCIEELTVVIAELPGCRSEVRVEVHEYDVSWQELPASPWFLSRSICTVKRKEASRSDAKLLEQVRKAIEGEAPSTPGCGS